MTFDLLKSSHEWKAIRNCPGRFVLTDKPPAFGITDLLGSGIDVMRFHSPKAKDVVCVMPLDNGGIISYERASGTWLHTLNTEEGFKRKLDQLEISINKPS
jgi:hypothetical protein